MKKPSNPQMAELGPFYQVCLLGLISCAFVPLLLFCWFGTSAWGWPFAPISTGVTVVLFLATWRVIHRRQMRRLEERAARRVARVRPRLQHTLDALEDKLREFSGVASARIVLLPESAVVLSTLSSGREPVVEMTAGFLCTYASNPRLMHAALAHEAGHIAARDVERFRRMLSLMQTLALFVLPFLAITGLTASVFLVGVLAFGLPLFWLLFVAGFVVECLALALALALAWSALLVAREVQADAFAAKVLGERRPMEALLEHQLALRMAQAGQRTALQRLRTWLLQPNLRWRSTLPFLRGRIGVRVEAKLGLATAAFLSSVVWLSAIVLLAVHASDGLSLGMTLGAMAWGSWIAYRFFWVRSRALGSGDSGTRSSGLRSVLSFCLPGGAFFLVQLVCLTPVVGEPLWMGPAFVSLLATLAVLFWAAGKVSLVSARERQRDRPSLPLAGLSLLGILALAGLLYLTVFSVGASAPSESQDIARFMLAHLAAGLGVGMLAHRLAAPARTSGPPAEAHP